MRSASVQSAKPMVSFPRAAEGNLALVRGHYRLIDKPAQSAVTVENILAPRRERTLRRVRGQETVLLVQDGTDLNFAEHSAGKGMGLIGKNQHSEGSVELHMHPTLAISEDGLPLADCSALDGDDAAGPQTPEVPAAFLFTEIELMVLRDLARDRKLPTPDSVRQAVPTMAMMGGYLNRKGAPPPGHQKLWEGHIDLAAEARCYGRILRMGEHSW